ncbi:response regulator [Mastigocladopsis repens]|uniref:response regulator n=1 Tax=Mastigocladopsis repens TaxID=221287 RepID=UPI0002E1891A|nr:response regulator [Mastigocladopsis repens]
MLKPLQYRAGQLSDLLENLQSTGASGFIYINAIVNSEQNPRSRVVVLNNGEMVYGGSKILNNQEFARRIGIKLSHDWADIAVGYAAQKLQDPSSFRELLEQIVRIRVFKWEEIETCVHAQAVQVLEQTLPYAGKLQLDPTVQIDLSYGKEGHGLEWNKLIQDVACRHREWTALAPVIPSMEAVPQLSPGWRTVTDTKAHQHFHKWVDGRRSLIDIAEQLDQDPLELGRTYLEWVASGWITFVRDTPVTQEVAHVEEQRPIVLSVDDSSVVQILIRRALGDHYQVLFASSAVQALTLMNTNPIVLLLLDVTMPDIDGLEFCRTVRSIPKFKDLPIIMVTARDKFSDKLRGQIAGTTHYLTKPFEPEYLLEIVEKYVGQRRQKLKESPTKRTFDNRISEKSYL